MEVKEMKEIKIKKDKKKQIKKEKRKLGKLELESKQKDIWKQQQDGVDAHWTSETTFPDSSHKTKDVLIDYFPTDYVPADYVQTDYVPTDYVPTDDIPTDYFPMPPLVDDTPPLQDIKPPPLVSTNENSNNIIASETIHQVTKLPTLGQDASPPLPPPAQGPGLALSPPGPGAGPPLPPPGILSSANSDMNQVEGSSVPNDLLSQIQNPNVVLKKV